MLPSRETQPNKEKTVLPIKDHAVAVKILLDALVEKKIIACIPDKVEACKRALRELITEDDEIVTLIAGEDVLEEELEEIVSFLEREYDVEVEAHEKTLDVISEEVAKNI